MNKSRPPALLLGSDCFLALQLARILWRKGIYVVGVAGQPGSCNCASRAARRTVAFAEIKDDPEPFFRTLQKEHGMRPVVVPCTDDMVWWLNDHRETIGTYADFLIAPFDVLRLLTDKGLFYRHALEHGLPIPSTQFVDNAHDLQAASKEVSYPVIMKPARKSAAWMEITHRFKVLKVHTADELMKYGTKLIPAVGELILQEWIPGPESEMYELFVCFDKKGEPLIDLVSNKRRQWPPDIGVGSLAEHCSEEAVSATGLPILRELGYAGLGHMELKRNVATGSFHIIEMNTRAALNFPLCEACGVDMVYTYYCAAAGLPLPEARTVTRPGAKWICWKTDLASAFAHWKRGNLTSKEWVTSLRGNKWSADVQFDDLMPLLFNLQRKLRRGVLSPRARKAMDI